MRSLARLSRARRLLAATVMKSSIVLLVVAACAAPDEIVSSAPDNLYGGVIDTRAIDLSLTTIDDRPYAWAIGGNGQSFQLLLDVTRPAGTTPYPAVIYVHGGGWSTGGRQSTTDAALDPSNPTGFLASKGLVVFSIDYRMPCDAATNPSGVQDPQHLCSPTQFVYPVPSRDVQTAINWVKANGAAAPYYANTSHIALIGPSAGGQLVTLAASRKFSTGDVRPDYVVALSGPSSSSYVATAPGGCYDQTSSPPYAMCELYDTTGAALGTGPRCGCSGNGNTVGRAGLFGGNYGDSSTVNARWTDGSSDTHWCSADPNVAANARLFLVAGMGEFVPDEDTEHLRYCMQTKAARTFDANAYSLGDQQCILPASESGTAHASALLPYAMPTTSADGMGGKCFTANQGASWTVAIALTSWLVSQSW